MESAKEDKDLNQPDIDEKPYITDIPESKRTGRRRFRCPSLKYGGGVVGVIGILAFAVTLWQYVWRDLRDSGYVDFDPYMDQLVIIGTITLVGVLLYIFVDE